MRVGDNDMNPTYSQSDFLLTTSFPFRFNFLQKDPPPNRGAVVIFTPPKIEENSQAVRFFDSFIRALTLQRFSPLNAKGEKTGSYNERSFLIGRVVGLPGETIRMQNNTAYIQKVGESLFNSEFEMTDVEYNINTRFDQVSTESLLTPYFNEVSLEKDQFLILSDNRLGTNDSRYWGPVKRESIKGSVLLRYLKGR